MKIALVALLICISLWAKAQCNLTVKIDNFRTRSGKLLIALCNDPKDFYGKALQQQIFPIPTVGAFTYLFKNLPKGNYAIRLFQDVNNSGKLEKGMMGIPKEPYGLSGNPYRMGKPGFEDAAFELSGNQTLEIKLK